MESDRILNIEAKLAFQEKTIKDLHDELYAQQQEIEHLKSLCNVLVKQYKTVSDVALGSDGPANEKPPHY
jgi:SlyX protein